LKSAFAVLALISALSLSAHAVGKDGASSPASGRETSQPASKAASAPLIASVAALPEAPGVATAPVAAPPAAVVFASPRLAEKPHWFFDVKNVAGLAALGAGLTADALSTQKGLGLPGFQEINPIARPFVQSRAGAAVYNAGSFAFIASGMYLAHKSNHHKIERILPFALAAWEGFLGFRNYHEISTAPPTH